MHELCLKAWAMSPSPRMLDAGNDYYTCSKCGEKTSPPKPSKPIELDRLDEILYDNFYGHGLSKEIETAKAELLEWMKSLVLNDVIGADDEWDKKYPLSIKQDIKSRNQLRAELRTKINQSVGENKL